MLIGVAGTQWRGQGRGGASTSPTAASMPLSLSDVIRERAAPSRALDEIARAHDRGGTHAARGGRARSARREADRPASCRIATTPSIRSDTPPRSRRVARQRASRSTSLWVDAEEKTPPRAHARTRPPKRRPRERSNSSATWRAENSAAMTPQRSNCSPFAISPTPTCTNDAGLERAARRPSSGR